MTEVSLWPQSSLDLNTPHDYAIWGVLENKTNTTSRPNISSLKATIEEGCNNISEETNSEGIKNVSKAS